MKILKISTLALLATLVYTSVDAQMIRNRAIHFSRHRVKHHHHVKK